MAINKEKLLERYPEELILSKSNNQDPAQGPRLDVRAYLAYYNIQVKEIKKHGSSTLYVLEKCLFDENHRGGESAIVQTADGRLLYQCFHDSCKLNKWEHARQIISGQDKLTQFMTGLEPTTSSKGQNSYNSCNSLISDNVTSWPVLNSKALYGLAGQVVAAAIEHSEADPVAVLIAFLIRFAAEVGPDLVMYVGDTKHYARINAVDVGASAKSRKGTSVNPIDRIFAHTGDDYVLALTSPGPLSSGEGLIYNVRDEQKEWVVIDKKTQERVEMITDLGVTDKRLCIIDEEFGSALTCIKRDGNTLSTIIRQIWDHGNLEPLTKNNRIKATNAHICILVHITIFELQLKMQDSEVLNGFANRFLWVCVRRNKMVARPMPMSDAVVEALHGLIIKALKIAHSFKIMEFSDASWALWEKIYPDLSKDHPGLAGVVMNRAEVQVIRLSMVYALLDGQNIIEPHHLEAALALWEYCEKSVLFIFGDREEDAFTNKIIEALHENDLSLTDIHKLFQNNVSGNKIKNALKDLLSRGKISMSQNKKDNGQGRTVTRYALVKGTAGINSNELNENNELSQDVEYQENMVSAGVHYNERNEFNEIIPLAKDKAGDDLNEFNEIIELNPDEDSYRTDPATDSGIEPYDAEFDNEFNCPQLLK